MKKIIFSLLFFIAGMSGYGQWVNRSPQGNPYTEIYFRGALRADSALYPPRFSDTTAANRGNGPKYYSGNIILVGDSLWLRNSTASRWINITGLGSSSGTVTQFNFTDGNGFDGTVTNPNSTPTLSLTTTLLQNQVMYAGASGGITGVTVNATGTNKVLTQVSSGVPTWSEISSLVSANNGDTVILGNVGHGGQLVRNTLIPGKNFDYSIGDINDYTHGLVNNFTVAADSILGQANQISLVPNTAGGISLNVTTSRFDHNSGDGSLVMTSNLVTLESDDSIQINGTRKLRLNGGAGGVYLGAASPSASYFNYKNNVALDSILQTDANGKIVQVSKAGTLGGTAWLLTGNTVGADTKIIGTLDNFPFRIYTNNTEKVTVLANGNVGIGNTNPSLQFYVQGTDAGIALMRTDASASAEGFIAIGTQSSFVGQLRGISGGGLRFTNGGATTEWWRINSSGSFLAGVDNTYDIGAVGATRPRIGFFGTNVFSPAFTGGTSTTQSITYKTTTGVGTTGADHIFQVGNNGGTEAMRILNSGNVGIGTNNPARLLELYTSTNSLSIPLRLTNAGANIATGPAIEFYNASGQANQIAQITAVVGNAFINNVLGFDVQGSRVMSMLGATGNVLIGTTTDLPSSILTVNSTTKGFLLPRMTGVQRAAISSPADGLLAYQTNSNDANSLLGQWQRQNGTWRRFLTDLDSATLVSASGWTLTGNAGTTAGTNFVGTTDAQDLVFKRNSSEAFRVYGANNYIGIGTTTPAHKVSIEAGTMPAQERALNVTGTMPTVPTDFRNDGARFEFTAVNHAQVYGQIGMRTIISGTDNENIVAMYGENQATSTNTGVKYGNFGVNGTALGVTTGANTGQWGYAGNGNINYGLTGLATLDKASAVNIGVNGHGLNAGASGIQIGGYFGLHSDTYAPTYESSALLVDNGSTTSPIALFKDNGTTQFSFNDGGTMTIATTPSTSAGTYSILTRNLSTGVVEKILSSSIPTSADYWATNLNTAIAGTSRIGTSNNVSFPIYTNNTFRAVFDSNGRLGIGLLQPLDLLHIQTSTANTGIFVNAQTTGNPIIYFGINGSSKALFGAARNSGDLITGEAANDIAFRANGVNINFSTNSGSNLMWRINTSGHFLAGTDNTYDIGASTGTRPRTGYFATKLIVGGIGGGGANGIVDIYSAGGSLFGSIGLLPTLNSVGISSASGVIYMSGGTMKFDTDNTYDIGASGATRPRTGYYGTSVFAGTSMGIGVSSTTHKMEIAGGTIANSTHALKITGTLVGSSASGVGNLIDITSAGNASFGQHAVRINLQAGYNGSSNTQGIVVANYAQGSGVGILAGNFGFDASSTGITSGTNNAVWGYASGGNINHGAIGLAIDNKVSATNVGVLGFGRNTSGSSKNIGGFFALSSTDLTYESAALLADNGATTSPIQLWRDNGTEKIGIYNGGSIALSGSEGTSGYLLASAGAGAVPTWVAPTSVGINYNSNNGITETSNVFQLGGALIQNTLINGAFSLTLGNSGNELTELNVRSADITMVATDDLSLSIQDDANIIASGDMIVEGGGSSIGLTSSFIQMNPLGSLFFTMTDTYAALGEAATTTGVLKFYGSTSGTVTIQPQAAAGTYNFNLPTTAGTSGYFLTSAGGGSSAMTWTDPASIISSNAWTLTGNTVGADTKWIGTIDNFPFRVKTNNTEKLTVLGNGNVGIGVTNPTLGKFQVHGDDVIVGIATTVGGTTASAASLYIGGNGTYTQTAALIVNNPYNTGSFINTLPSALNIYNESDGGDIVLHNYYNDATPGDIIFAIGNDNNLSSERMRLTTTALQLGMSATNKGTLIFYGNTSGAVTIQPQAAAGTYNFNLPTTAGTSGYVLTSAGGAGSAMTWTNPASLGSTPDWQSVMTVGNTSTVAGYIVKTGIGTTSTDGLILQNLTPGSGGFTGRLSPRLGFTGPTDGNMHHAIVELEGGDGGFNQRLNYRFANDAAAFVTKFSMSSGGSFFIHGSTSGYTTLTSPAVAGASLVLPPDNGTVGQMAVTDGSGVLTFSNLTPQARGYKVYTAILSQSGTSAPTATVLQNDLGGTVVWARTNPGEYTATLSSAFTNNKTAAIHDKVQVDNSMDNPVYYKSVLTSTSVITFYTSNGTANLSDDMLTGAYGGTFIYEIRVYY